MTGEIVFKTRQEYLQSAFNAVAQVVNDHGNEILECSIPAYDTEKCLSHLSVVCLAWSYDNTLIEAQAENYKKFNEEMREHFGDDHENYY